MNTHLNLLANLAPPAMPDEPDCSYEDIHVELSGQLMELHLAEADLDSAIRVMSFLEHNKISNSTFQYINDTFGIESYLGVPFPSITDQNQSVCTELCLEGVTSMIGDIIAKIVAFFKRLYETIANFLGLKNFRFRRTERDFQSIQQSINEFSDFEFEKRINRIVYCNVSTMRMKDIDALISDCKDFYNLIGRSKDIAQITNMVTTTGGMLTKIGHKVQDEYKIVNEAGLPYEVLEANQPLNIKTSFGIDSRQDVNTRIAEILKIQATILDLQKWYPLNLKKYAARATNITVAPGDAEAEKLQKQNILVLNEEQKCQAYLCKMIILYTNLVDLLCAKGIATFKSILAKEQ